MVEKGPSVVALLAGVLQRDRANGETHLGKQPREPSPLRKSRSGCWLTRCGQPGGLSGVVRRQTRELAVFAQSGLQCRARGDRLQGSVSWPERRERMRPSSTCLFGPSPPWSGRGPPICFPQSANPDAGLFRKVPCRHTRRECLTSFLGIQRPSQGDT